MFLTAACFTSYLSTLNVRDFRDCVVHNLNKICLISRLVLNCPSHSFELGLLSQLYSLLDEQLFSFPSNWPSPMRRNGRSHLNSENVHLSRQRRYFWHAMGPSLRLATGYHILDFLDRKTLGPGLTTVLPQSAVNISVYIYIRTYSSHWSIVYRIAFDWFLISWMLWSRFLVENYLKNL